MGLAEAAAPGLNVAEADAVYEALAVSEELPVADAVSEELPVTVAVALELAVRVGDGVRLLLEPKLRVAVAEMLIDGGPEAVVLAVSVMDADSVCVAVIEAVSLRVGVAENE